METMNLSVASLKAGNNDRVHAFEAPLQRLLRTNQDYLKEFETNPLFRLVRSDLFKRDGIRQRFMDCFQVWSNKYQKMVLARSVFCESPRFHNLTQQHLVEEFGHNADLDKMRAGRPTVWDPVLEASANWFVWKIMTLSETEKILLVHQVVETSATIFYKYVRPALAPKVDSHFAIHDVLDHEHGNMGLEELADLSKAEFARLEQLQSEGWAMLNLVMSRIAELTIKFEVSA